MVEDMELRRLFKEAGKLRRWQTTNMEYGRFYRHSKAGTERKRTTLHADCEKKYDALRRQSVDCKHKIEQLRLQASWSTTPNDHCISNIIEGISHPLKESLQNQDMFSAELATCSAHGELNSGSCVNKQEDGGPADLPDVQEMDCVRETIRPWKPKPLKPIILFEKKVKNLDPIESLLPSKTKMGDWIYKASLHYNRRQAHRQNKYDWTHPSTRRYSYYKYYGLGGQGAKTSWGHNFPLGQKPLYAARARELTGV